MQLCLRSLIILLLLLSGFRSISLAQPEQGTYYYQDFVYDPLIQTVAWRRSGSRTSYPIISLNQGTMHLRFDDLNPDARDFKYTIIHCDYNWRPSDLVENQYMEGLWTDFLMVNNSSANTYQPYNFYSLSIPNENMSPKIGGNYLLLIYDANDESKPILTRRFFVVEPYVGITGFVRQATLTQYRLTHHELEFNVNLNALNVLDPFTDLKLMVRQNGRWDNALINVQPSFFRDEKVIYNNQNKNLFLAGNEFRVLDLREARFGGQNIRRIYLDSIYHATLYYDESKQYSPYFQFIDINGRRLIEIQNGDPNIDGDYIMCQFYLQAEEVEDGEVYVFGEMTDWQAKPEYKMEYNEGRRRYEAQILLKQGYYNYQYAIKRKNQRRLDITTMEGSHFETENDYGIYVYWRSFDLQADILVGYEFFNSGVINGTD